MKQLMIGLVAASLGVGIAPAQAQNTADEGLPSWLSGNVMVTSDYVFRGITQSLEEPAIQGGIDLAHPSGLYVGTWGSSVNFGEDLAAGPRAHMELDVYGGFGTSLAGLVDLRAGAIYYAYPGAEEGRNYNFAEFGLGASRSLGPLGANLSLQYSPDFFAGSGTGLYYGGGLSIPVSALTVSGQVGRQMIEDNGAFGTPDYVHYGVGLGLGWMGFGINGQYLGTNLDEGECFGGSELCEGRVVFSISRTM